MTKIAFQFADLLDFDPGYGKFTAIPDFGAGLFAYALGGALNPAPAQDLFGVAANLAITGAPGTVGFQANNGAAFLDLPYTGRQLLAVGGGAATLTIVAKVPASTLLLGDNTAQPSTEPRLTMYRTGELIAGVINDGAAAGGQSANPALAGDDAGQATSWAVYSDLVTNTTAQVGYRRAGFAGGAEQLSAVANKADADPVGNTAAPLRFGRHFPGTPFPTNTASAALIVGHRKLLSAAERAELYTALQGMLAAVGEVV